MHENTQTKTDGMRVEDTTVLIPEFLKRGLHEKAVADRVASEARGAAKVAKPAATGTDLLYAPSEPVFGIAGPMMLAQGWSVVPQQRNRKPSIINGRMLSWQHLQDALPDAEEMAAFCVDAPKDNVAVVMGEVSGRVFCMDIDCLDLSVSLRVQQMVAEHLGRTPFQRIGREPKTALFYRYPEGSGCPRSETLPFEQHPGCMVELKGHGMLMTMYGIHHETGRYYHWPDALPLSSGPDTAPEVTLIQVKNLLDAIKADFKVAPRSQASCVFVGPSFDGSVTANGLWTPAPRADDKLKDGREAYITSLTFGLVWRNQPTLLASKSEGTRADITVKLIDLAQKDFLQACEVSGRWNETFIRRKAASQIAVLMEKLDAGDMPSFDAREPVAAVVESGEEADEPAVSFGDGDADEPVSIVMPDEADTQPAEVSEVEQDQDDGEPAQEDVKATGKGKVQIRLAGGDIGRTVDEVERILVAREVHIFQRGGKLVRVSEESTSLGGEFVVSKVLSEIGPFLLADIISRHVLCLRHDGRKKAWVACDLPMNIVYTLLERSGSWMFRPLEAVLGSPILRPDGSLLSAPGYDAATAFYLDTEELDFSIPDAPTKKDAEEALAKFDELLGGFPFVAPQDKAVAMACILTAVIRRTLPAAPVFAFSATVWGSGKGKLVNIASIVAQGRRASVMDVSTSNDEMDKKVNSELLKGSSHVAMDELKKPLGGPLFQAMTTSGSMSVRVLGQSRTVLVSTTFLCTVTGNKLEVLADMTRRVMKCNLDPKTDKPHLREFAYEPEARALAHRVEYTKAALTILRAYVVSGDRVSIPVLGSFEQWCERVCKPLVWLGMTDPKASLDETADNDPEVAEHRAVMTQWGMVIGAGKRVTAKSLIDAAVVKVDATDWRSPFKNDGFREALLEATQENGGGGGSINSKALGQWLRKHAGRYVEGMRILKGPLLHGIATWVLDGSAAPQGPGDGAHDHEAKVEKASMRMEMLERQLNLARMSEMAQRHFGSPTRAEAWLLVHDDSLGGAPIDVLDPERLRMHLDSLRMASGVGASVH